jgi:hypothetical protein
MYTSPSDRGPKPKILGGLSRYSAVNTRGYSIRFRRQWRPPAISMTRAGRCRAREFRSPSRERLSARPAYAAVNGEVVPALGPGNHRADRNYLPECQSGARYSGLAGHNRVALCGCDSDHVDREPIEDDGALLSTPLDLIFPDNALLPIHLALDSVLKHVACLRKLPDHLVAPLAFSILAGTGRKVQGLPDGKFVCCHVLLQQQYAARYGGILSLTNATRF